MGRGQKRKVTQMDVARACGIDQGSVSRILNSDTRDSFAKETIKKVYTIARELGYLHPTLISSDRRESKRTPVTISALVKIITKAGEKVTAGTAEVEEVSGSGMVLGSFNLNNPYLPMEPFWIDVEVTTSELKGFLCRCSLARIVERDDRLTLAVKMRHAEEASRKLLKNWFSSQTDPVMSKVVKDIGSISSEAVGARDGSTDSDNF